MKVWKVRGASDAFGMFASGVCLLHCVGIPLVLLALPMLEIYWLESESWFHHAMVWIVAIPAAIAFVLGYRQHKRVNIFFTAGIGLALIAAAAFYVAPNYGETWEMPVTVLGSLFLIATHLRNRALCATCAV
jgi:hypothetical protein